MNYSLVYTSQAGSIDFSFDSGFVVETFDAFGGLDTEFTTAANANGYGDKVESYKVRPMNITVSGTIVGRATEKRQMMYRAFAPMQPAKLVFDGQWYMDVFLKKSPTIEPFSLNPKFSFMLYAPVPYWRNSGGTTAVLNGVSGLFSFPVLWGDGIQFSTMRSGTANVINDGDAPCAWEMSIVAGEKMVNPTVTKTATGEFIRVNTTITAGQQLLLSTTGDEMNATVIHEDGTAVSLFDAIDIDSTRFALTVGDNMLTITPESEKALTTVTYSKMLTGV